MSLHVPIEPNGDLTLWNGRYSLCSVLPTRWNLYYFLTVFLLIGLLTGTGHAASTEAARRMVFMLQYVASDYPFAVSDGEIIDELEYQEMLDFSTVIEERLSDVRADMDQASWQQLADLVGELRVGVTDKLDPQQVSALSERAIPVLIDAFDIKPVPRQPPDSNRGGDLYREACASCHGLGGDGDGPAAKDLESPPLPARFTDAERMNRTPPYVFFNAITFGIDGTAMASFADAYDEQDRWNLAFYLWTFQAPEQVPAVADLVALSLRDLATRPTVDLESIVRTQANRKGRQLEQDDAMALVAHLRLHPVVPTNSLARLQRIRERLEEIRSLVARQQFDDASEEITDAYLEDFEPIEPELDRRDTAVRRQFEATLIEFRKALRAQNQDGAAILAKDLITSIDLARLVLDDREVRPLGTLRFLGIITIALLVGLVIIWWSTARRAGQSRDIR